MTSDIFVNVNVNVTVNLKNHQNVLGPSSSPSR